MKRTKQDIKKKKNNHGCGKAKCFVCHSEKILDIPSKQEEKAELDYNEQLLELDYSRHPIDKNDHECSPEQSAEVVKYLDKILEKKECKN